MAPSPGIIARPLGIGALHGCTPHGRSIRLRLRRAHFAPRAASSEVRLEGLPFDCTAPRLTAELASVVQARFAVDVDANAAGICESGRAAVRFEDDADADAGCRAIKARGQVLGAPITATLCAADDKGDDARHSGARGSKRIDDIDVDGFRKTVDGLREELRDMRDTRY